MAVDFLQFRGEPLFSSSPSTFAVDGATKKLGAVMVCPKAGSISHVYVAANSVSSPVGFTVELQSVATLVPTGTVLSSSTTSFTPSTAGAWISLANAHTVSAGDVIAVVINYGASGSATLYSRADGIAASAYSVDYSSSWTARQLSPVLSAKYSDGQILRPTLPVIGVTGGAYANNTSVRERGNVYVASVAMQLNGVRLFSNHPSNAHSIVAYLDQSTTPSQTLSFAASTFAAGYIVAEYWFASAISISSGQTFRIVLRPDNASALNFGYRSFLSTTERDHCVGPYCRTERGTGGWTDYSTNWTCMTPIVSGFVGGGNPQLVNGGLVKS